MTHRAAMYYAYIAAAIIVAVVFSIWGLTELIQAVNPADIPQ